jgi:hypothetical protein
MVYNLFEWLWSAPVVANFLLFFTLLAAAAGAAATVYIACLARPNLKALLDYVADTKRLVQIANDQLENAQTPFVVLSGNKNPNPLFMAEYQLENQGSGPALNVNVLLHYDDGHFARHYRATTQKNAAIDLEPSAAIVSSYFDYQSMSGRKYFTKMENGQTFFGKV